MLLGKVGDGPHRLGCPLVMLVEVRPHARVAILFHARAILAVAVGRAAERPVVLGLVAPQRLVGGEWLVPAVPKEILPVGGVVDWHVIVHRVAGAAAGVVSRAK